jgi:hypothetical protein
MTDMDYEAIAAKVAEHIQAGTFARPLMSAEDVARGLGVSVRKARALVAEDGPIPSFKIDGSRRVDPREFDKFVEAQKQAR